MRNMSTKTQKQSRREGPVPGIEGIRDLPVVNRRLPAEWEPQDALMIAWPHRANGWKGDMADVDAVFVEMVKATARHQRVLIACKDQLLHDHAAELLREAGVDMENCLLKIVATNDCWVRDTGPIGIFENGKLKLLDFRFNAWGGKYESADDDQINTRLALQGVFNCELQSLPIILEGGSIESNGKGSLLTTTSCLLTDTRNNCYDQNRIEDLLKYFFGLQTVHWLKHGHIEGDDTDGHVDTLARFCPNDTIAYASCVDETDSNFAGLAMLAQELQSLRKADGTAYRLVAFPIPSPKFDMEGNRLPCTYVNFMIINDAILCPLYDDPMDEHAMSRLKTIFPDHDIIGINALPVVEQSGSFHCLCMQLTKGTLAQV